MDKKQEHLSEAEEAKKILDQDKRERVAKCQKEIEEAVKKYNCVLNASAVLTSQGIRFNINIIAK